jgi:ATP-dependent DNA ligase
MLPGTSESRLRADRCPNEATAPSPRDGANCLDNLELLISGLHSCRSAALNAQNKGCVCRADGLPPSQRDSRYEPGKRSGAWVKHRLNLGQEFVIGGYTPGPHGLDAIIVGYYRGKDLIYVARTRNGFVPASRRRVFEKVKPLVSPTCPFVNLPETHKARWGQALTADKMKKCVWVKPEIVARLEFLEWTDADHLRHSKFVGLRDDKDARNVVKE